MREDLTQLVGLNRALAALGDSLVPVPSFCENQLLTSIVWCEPQFRVGPIRIERPQGEDTRATNWPLGERLNRENGGTYSWLRSSDPKFTTERNVGTVPRSCHEFRIRRGAASCMFQRFRDSISLPSGQLVALVVLTLGSFDSLFRGRLGIEVRTTLSTLAADFAKARALAPGSRPAPPRSI